MKMIFAWAIAALMFLPSALAASTVVPIDLTFTFKAEKTEHRCLPNSADSYDEHPGHGNCGGYQWLELGEKRSGYLRIAGNFSYRNNVGSYMSSVDVWECRYGEQDCVGSDYALSETSLGGYWVQISEDFVTLDPGNWDYNLSFEFDLARKSGVSRWDDDDEPWLGAGVIEFKNVKVTGMPGSSLPGCGPSGGVPRKCDDDISAVPLPASLPLLALGLGGLPLLRRYRRT